MGLPALVGSCIRPTVVLYEPIPPARRSPGNTDDVVQGIGWIVLVRVMGLLSGGQLLTLLLDKLASCLARFRFLC